jgi:hypothetical protein
MSYGRHDIAYSGEKGAVSNKKSSKLESLIQRLEAALESVEMSDRRISTVIDQVDGPRPTEEGVSPNSEKAPYSPSTLARMDGLINRLENVSSRLSGNASEIEMII